MVNFRHGKYFVIGYGIVGRAVADHLPITENHRLVIIDRQNVSLSDKLANNPNVILMQYHLTKSNYQEIFDSHTLPGSVIIETAVETDTASIAAWSYANERHFINTVCDFWVEDTLIVTNNYKCIDNILVQYVDKVLKVCKSPSSDNNPTSIIGCGANIGMVNTWFKLSLNELARLNKTGINEIAKRVTEVYILEKDTLVFKKDFVPEPNTFYNTWNIQEFLLESCAHTDYPNGGKVEQSTRALTRDVFLDDYIIHGRVVAHEETYSINDYLTSLGGKPKIQFLYECSPVGEYSRMKFKFGEQYVSRCATTELDPSNGYDLVGALVVLDDNTNWFVGFCMEQDKLGDMVNFTNATAWYVSASVLAGVKCIEQFPNSGVNFPESLELNQCEAIANEFLRLNPKGKLISRPIKNLFMTDEYPTYEVLNLYSTNRISYNPH